jgi:putative transposase
MKAVEKLSPSVGTSCACKALAVPRASYYRSKAPARSGEQSTRRPPVRALSPEQRQGVLNELHSERFVDKSPTETYASLLDDGIYLCSVRTMYRILSDAKEVRERRNQVRHPNYRKPELLATGPNQVWSWDITKLLGPAKWTYFYLYVILDIFSRYVVGWMIASRESADLATRLIRETVEKQAVSEDQLIIHSDRGPSMKSHSVAQLLGALGITKSHSRPHVSNDNPFSESQFKTLKYRPDFPCRFGSQQDAHAFCREFFSWYNDEHYHSGIGLLTPASVHYVQANDILAKRQEVLDAAYARHPERFVNKAPSPLDGPTAVWINPPRTTSDADCDKKTPLIEIHTPSRCIAPKTQFETSSLTNAQALTRLQMLGPTESSLNTPAHPQICDRGNPDASLTYPQPGYPLPSCVPLELDSASPGVDEHTSTNLPPQSLNTRVMPEKISGVGGLAPEEAVTVKVDKKRYTKFDWKVSQSC